MEIAVISDLHLGAGDITDRFGHSDDKFLAFLKFLENNFERIILLGDIYETLMPEHLGRHKEALDVCYRAHKRIIDKFQGPQYTYIHGNHDIVTKSVLSAPEELLLKVNNQNILFMHGHQCDTFIQKMRWLSEAGVFLGGWLLRLGLEPLYKFFAQMDIKTPSQLEQILNPFEKLAFQTAQSKNADIIVTGHTHVAIRHEHANKLYLNSGTCSNGQISFLSLDTQTGMYKINKKW